MAGATLVVLGVLWPQDPSPEDGTRKLIRDLERSETTRERLRAQVWSALPGTIQAHLPALRPYPVFMRRSLAATDLALIAPPPPGAVPALIRGLDDPHPSVRLRCLQTLGAFGPVASSAIPPVLALAESRTNALELRLTSLECLLGIAPNDPRIRALARETFLRTADVGPDPTLVLRKIAPLYRSQDPEFLDLLFDLLPKLGATQAAQLIEGLNEILPPTPRAASGAVLAIKSFFFPGALPQDARRPVARMDHPRLSHALGALLARSCVPAHAEANVQLIRDLLRHGSMWSSDADESNVPASPGSSRLVTLARAAQILVKQGPAAREAMPELLALLDKSSPELEFSVAWTVWRIDPGNPQALAILQSHADTTYDMGIILSLLDLTTSETPAFHPLVRRCLGDSNETIRDAARRAARRSGIAGPAPGPAP